MSTVTNTQVAVKYRRNVGSLSIDMSADNRTTTLGLHIDRHIGRVSVDISTHGRPICRPIYRGTLLGRHIDRHSTDKSTDISVDTGPICRPKRRSTVGRDVDRYVGRGVHKIHMIHSFLGLFFLSHSRVLGIHKTLKPSNAADWGKQNHSQFCPKTIYLLTINESLLNLDIIT